MLLQTILLRDSSEEEVGKYKKTKHKTKEVTMGSRKRSVVRDLVWLRPPRRSEVQVGRATIMLERGKLDGSYCKRDDW